MILFQETQAADLLTHSLTHSSLLPPSLPPSLTYSSSATANTGCEVSFRTPRKHTSGTPRASPHLARSPAVCCPLALPCPLVACQLSLEGLRGEP